MNSWYVALLALCMWREARGEGLEGMTAVGLVIQNRVRRWNQSWSSVIVGKNQFSSMTVPGDSQLVVWPTNETLFQQAYMKAWDIFKGECPDITNGALYYAYLPNVTSGWFLREIISKSAEHPVLAKVGRHTFYA